MPWETGSLQGADYHLTAHLMAWEASGSLACWQATVDLFGVCWHWQGSQLGKVKALGCLAGGETCEERRGTGPGYSAHPGC